LSHLPQVSIIIPALNAEKYLPACFASLRALDYPKGKVEILLVDNGSVDRTPEIGRDNGATFLDGRGLKVSGLRNLGARNARGEILAFVDADCLVGRDWIKNAIPYFEKKDVAVWGAPPAIPDKATWVQRAWYLVRKKEKTIQDVEWLESMNLFVRRDQFLAIGGFNEELVTCEDVDFSYRMGEYGRILSDSRISVVHLGEAGTLRDFVKKEVWRGKSNLQGIRSHGLTLKEIPSLCIPVYFGVFLPLILLFIFLFLSPGWTLAALALFLLPSLFILVKVKAKGATLTGLLHLLILLQLYFISRTMAVMKR